MSAEDDMLAEARKRVYSAKGGDIVSVEDMARIPPKDAPGTVHSIGAKITIKPPIQRTGLVMVEMMPLLFERVAEGWKCI